MSIKQLLITKYNIKFWLSLSLIFSLIYSSLALREAFISEYVVQDDARQHVFWMLRFLNPNLFPQDLITNYFQSVAPRGYTAFYQLFAMVGINPLLLNKLLPPLLGLVTTGYCFGVCMEMLPLPTAGFVSTLLLNQIIWMKEDLISATPRAFAYPLFLAFLYYLLQGSLLGCVVAIALLGLFYPHYLLISIVILIVRLWDWENLRPRLSQNQNDYILCYTGLAIAFIALLPYALTSSEFGPAITAAEARQLPEFLPGGRTQFFHENIWKFWFNGQRSGFFPRQLFKPIILYVGLLLPLLLRFPSAFPLVKQVTNSVKLLPQIAIASLVMFFAAHAFLFKLHVPSRYTGQSLRIIMSLAAGITLIIILDAVFHWARKQIFLAWVTMILVSAALILYPVSVEGFPFTKYRVGEVPALYEFFQKQPQDILIASVAEEVNNLPTFSQRSILAGRKYAVPYQVGYYYQFRHRTIELIRAHYSENLAEVKSLISKYGIDFWLLERSAFTPEYVANHEWIGEYQPVTSEALGRLKQGIEPALSKVMQCSVFEAGSLVVLQGECITKL